MMAEEPPMKPIAIVQARMTSTRLPGKVLKDLCGQTVLHYVVRRCRLSRRLAGVVLATTDEPADDCLVEIAQSLGIVAFRGSRDDVLDRYMHAAWAPGLTRSSALPAIVRLSSRRSSIASWRATSARAEFVYTDGFPRGTGDSELVPLAALRRAWCETRPDETYYREHVLTYAWRHPERFRHQVVERRRKSSDWTIASALTKRMTWRSFGGFAATLRRELISPWPRCLRSWKRSPKSRRSIATWCRRPFDGEKSTVDAAT